MFALGVAVAVAVALVVVVGVAAGVVVGVGDQMKRAGLKKRKKKDPLKAYLGKLTRAIVLHRDGYACRWCERKPKELHAAHIYSQGAHPAMRYTLDNVVALCKRCHLFRAHRDVTEFVNLCRRLLGPSKWRRLEIQAGSKAGKQDLEAIRLYLEHQAEKIGALLP